VKRLFGLLPFLLFTFQTFSQIDQEFWFVAPEVAQGHGDRPIYIRVATMADPANITLEIPANAAFTPMTQFVAANSVHTFDLTPWIDIIENRPANSVLDRGLHMTSDKQITAYYEVIGGNVNPAIFSLKGKNALGKEFFIVSQNLFPNVYGSESFDIVAIEDQTTVTITVTDDITGHAAGSTFQVILNKGQTYCARSTSTAASRTLAGSHITSDKSIAVTWNDDSIQPEITGGGFDIVADQTIPINLLGTEYIAIKGFADNIPGNNDERVFMLATQNNTDIFIDGGTTPYISNLISGQLCNYAIPPGSNTALINATKPIYVLHISGYSQEAGGSILPQDYCTGSRQIGFNRTLNLDFALMVLTRTGNESAFTVNGSNSILTATDFLPVTGSNGVWVYARKSMTTTQVPVGQNIIANSLGKFHLGILNALGGSAEYGYFSDFSSLYLGSDHNICPNSDLTLDGGSGMATYEWKKNQWNGSWTTLGTSRYFTLPDSGMYACMTNGDFCTLYDTIRIGYFPYMPVNLGPDQVKCAGQTALLDAGIGYTHYDWSTGETTQSIIVSTTDSYSVTVTDNNSCTDSDTVMVTFNPPPVPVISGNWGVCSSSTDNIYSTENGMTGYNWSISTGGTITAGGSSADNTATVTWDIPNASSNDRWISVSYTNANGCTASIPTTNYVTVKPLPNVVPAAPSPLTICSGANAQVALSSNIPGTETITTFDWTASGNNAAITPVPSSISGSGDILQNLANSGNILEPVVFHILPTASGCSPASPSDFTFNVNPIPVVSSSPGTRQVICSATATQPITLQTNVTGLSPTYNWTTVCDPGITNGPPAGGTDNPIASFAPGNSTTSQKSITYTIFASLDASSGSCSGPTSGYTILVNPRPNVTNPVLSQVICSGLQSAPVVLLSDIPGTAFSWVSSASPGITGNTPSGNGDLPTETLFNGTTSQGSATYTITPSFSQDGVSCTGPTSGYTILVNPRPNVTNPVLSQVICSGLQSAPAVLLSDIPGTTFSWVSSASPGITGNTPSGNGDLPTETLFNGTTSQGSATYTITPSFSQDGVSCTGPTKDYTILVNPLPQPSLTGSVSICEGITGIVYTTQAGMASYSWTVSPSGSITAGGSSSSSSVTVTWNTALPNQYVEVNYVDLSGCTALSPTRLNVTVNATPVLTVSGTGELCAASSNVNYSTAAGMSLYAWTISSGGTPVGAVNTNSVNVNWDAGASPMQSVTVGYTNPLGCSNSTVYPVTIRPLPVSTFTGSAAVCQLHPDAYLYPANSGPACSYTWSVNPSSAGSIANATISPASITWNTTGTATLRLDAVTPFGCTSFSSQPITINPRPDVSITPCFDPVTSRSAKRFLLKGGVPLLTATPLQGEYLINPPTVALVFESGNYYFDPTLVPGTNTINYNIYYKYTSSRFGCPATSSNSVTLTVHGSNPTCSSSMTDYRDNTTYRTSFAGGKCWMMENLRYGTSLTPATTVQSDNCVAEKYCLSSDANCTRYGGFYQWNELIQYGVTASPEYQGVCPPGWHIPSAADFQALIDANQGNALAGATLTDLNLNPRGFEALFTGMAYLNTAWAFTSSNVPAGTLFWTSTPGSGNKIVTRGMNNKVPSVSLYETSGVNAFPIRCVKD